MNAGHVGFFQVMTLIYGINQVPSTGRYRNPIWKRCRRWGSRATPAFAVVEPSAKLSKESLGGARILEPRK